MTQGGIPEDARRCRRWGEEHPWGMVGGVVGGGRSIPGDASGASSVAFGAV